MIPTLRLKKRYIQFEVTGPLSADVSESEARDELFGAFYRFFGENEYGNVAFKLISYDPRTKTGEFRVNRDRVEDALACLALTHQINGKAARYHATRVSGTLASMRRKSKKKDDECE